MERLSLKAPPFIHENPHWAWDTSQRDHYNLWICIEGTARLVCQDVEYSIMPWTAFIFTPDLSLHGTSNAPEQKFKNFSAHWQPIETSGPPPEFPLMGIPINEIDTAKSLIQALIRLSAFRDPLARQQSEWLLLELIALIWRETQSPRESPADNIIYRQIERIRSGKDLFASVDNLAREANLSRIHYNRRFRRIAADSPNRFLIRQRIERACMLLRETTWTIETIAEKIGYSDVYFFSRQFRQVLNTTPKQFRDKIR